VLKLIKHKDIDRTRWDIIASKSSRAYFLSWYLDAVSPGWDALVWEEYKYIMPLTHTKKYGFKLLVQPPFCQQTGILSTNKNLEIENKFHRYIKKHYIWSFWQGNSEMASKSNYSKQNFTLLLKRNYTDIRDNYSRNHKKNIKKYLRSHSYVSTTEMVKAYEFIKKHVRYELSSKSWNTLKRIMQKAQETNKLECLVSIHKSQIEAVSVFIWEGRSVLLIASASTAEGYEHSAQYGIIDYFITENANRHIILDFEGSSIDSIAYFYQGFSPEKETYHCFKHSKIPFL